MKYLKRFNESIEDIDSICREYGIRNYTINQDGTVDVQGDVNLSWKKLTRLPLKFGKVSGSFWCQVNELTTLEGCPTEVGDSFGCTDNKLTTLKGCPEKVGGDFYCAFNKLTTLELTTLDGFPKNISVGGNFICNNNKLDTLKGCSTKVSGRFVFWNNKLTIINWNDVHHLSDSRGPFGIDVKANPIYEVCRVFPDPKSFIDSIEWNYFKEPNIIIKERFVEACEVLSEETGESIVIPEKIEGYIFE